MAMHPAIQVFPVLEDENVGRFSPLGGAQLTGNSITDRLNKGLLRQLFKRLEICI